MAFECLEASAPSHVHVGNIDIHGGIGRLYGTLGFALNTPRLRVRVCKSTSNTILGTRRSDVEGYVDLFSELYNVKLRVEFLEEIPPHVGLGSTTPIALSIGMAAAILSGRNYSLEEIALKAGRSRVSALGYYAFKLGGFICDGGYRVDREGVPPLVLRVPVPERYRIVYAVPTRSLEEILRVKAVEDKVLASMPAMSMDMAERNARIVLMGVLPAAAEGDWETAGKWLYELNRGLGEYWASKQGGVYCCSEAEELIRFYLSHGALCACQSSWGPTVYGLYYAVDAPRVHALLAKLLEELGGGLSGVARVDNSGAVLRVQQHG